MILKFRDLIEKLEKDVYAVLRLEKEEKAMVHSEAQVMCCLKKKDPDCLCEPFVFCLGFYLIILCFVVFRLMQLRRN